MEAVRLIWPTIFSLRAGSHPSFFGYRRDQIVQLDKILIVMKALPQFVNSDGVGTEYDDVCMTQNVADIVPKQCSDVRDIRLDELPVRSNQLAKRDIVVPDLDVATFGDKPLHEMHNRAFPQVVRARLEAQSQHADLAL